MTLKEQIAADAAVFTNPDEFGESVKLWLDDGTSKTVSALVDRQVPRQDDRTGAIVLVTLVRLAVADVAAWKPGDDIELAPTIGGPLKRCRQTRLVDQDPGLWTVEVQA